MPLTRGTWFSSAENGQRLCDAAFFSLEMLTTVRCTLSTASTTAVRRVAAGVHVDRERSRGGRHYGEIDREFPEHSLSPSLRRRWHGARPLCDRHRRLSSRPDPRRPRVAARPSRAIAPGLVLDRFAPFPSLSPLPLMSPSFP